MVQLAHGQLGVALLVGFETQSAGIRNRQPIVFLTVEIDEFHMIGHFVQLGRIDKRQLVIAAGAQRETAFRGRFGLGITVQGLDVAGEE